MFAMRRKRTAHRAITLVEMLVASGVMIILLMALMPLLSSSARAWHRNAADVFATMDVTLAMRRITSELRRARSINVNLSQTQVTYVLPSGANGVIGLSGETLKWHPAEGSADTVCLIEGVVPIDPATGTTYPLFQVGANGSTITVRLCVRRQTPVGTRYLRLQEMVMLRNR
jgi:type II secretory pathway pseudopilin PulG